MPQTKRLCVILIFGLLTPLLSMAQTPKKLRVDFLSIHAGGISSSFPLTGISSVFKAPFRPYVEIGASQVFSEKKHHAWEHEVNLGYFYHRFMQHGIPFYYNTVFRFEASEAIGIGAKLGVGYLHSIPAVERFRLNDQGEYEKIKALGRPQAMGTLALLGNYKLNDQIKLSLQYRMILQMPFIKSYVPMLPYNSIQLGLSYALNNKTK